MARDFNRKLRGVGILPDTPAWEQFHVECFDLRNEDDNLENPGLASSLDVPRRKGVNLNLNLKTSKRLSKKSKQEQEQIQKTEEVNFNGVSYFLTLGKNFKSHDYINEILVPSVNQFYPPWIFKSQCPVKDALKYHLGGEL